MSKRMSMVRARNSNEGGQEVEKMSPHKQEVRDKFLSHNNGKLVAEFRAVRYLLKCKYGCKRHRLL